MMRCTRAAVPAAQPGFMVALANAMATTTNDPNLRMMVRFAAPHARQAFCLHLRGRSSANGFLGTARFRKAGTQLKNCLDARTDVALDQKLEVWRTFPPHVRDNIKQCVSASQTQRPRTSSCRVQCARCLPRAVLTFQASNRHHTGVENARHRVRSIAGCSGTFVEAPLWCRLKMLTLLGVPCVALACCLPAANPVQTR